jgi:hypothetical protein
MKLTKENYEFLMFELLEGNLNSDERNVLLEQINKDAFYQREWTLMQHSVMMPDTGVLMPNKDHLIKPEGRKIAFFTFANVTKVAASLLLIGTFGWWYYSLNKNTDITFIPNETPLNNEIVKENEQETSKASGDEVVLKKQQNREATLSPIYTADVNPSKKSEIKPDSSLADNLPEILLIKPMGKEGIAYTIKQDNVLGADYLKLNKPVKREQNKIGTLLAQAENLITIANTYINDIPNLKFKVTPKLKERNIGFELKGETIYANAILEMK